MNALELMSGWRREKRAAKLSGMAPPPWSEASAFNAGVAVSPGTVAGIPAVGAAVRRAAEAVGLLELGAWTGDRNNPKRVTSGWRARLLRDQPNDQQTRFTFLETVEESLTFRGNAFIWLNRDPQSGYIVEWFALHPDQVMVTFNARHGKRYQVAVSHDTVDPVGRGNGFYDVDSATILHVKGHGGGLVAPSPIERYRSTLGVAVAKTAHEANVYRRGAPIRLAILYPEDMEVDQVTEWRDMWRQTYEGPHGNRTAVLGGGGTIQTIGMSQADAQFIESQNFSVSEVARMLSVQASLLDGGSSGKGADSAPLTPEHEADRWFRYGLLPRLRRIEAAVDMAVFPGSSQFALFDTKNANWADQHAMADIRIRNVQSGILLQDEAREELGLQPLPGGVGQIPQATPVGGESTNNPSPGVTQA